MRNAQKYKPQPPKCVDPVSSLSVGSADGALEAGSHEVRGVHQHGLAVVALNCRSTYEIVKSSMHVAETMCKLNKLSDFYACRGTQTHKTCTF
jgi:hypothetical protein